MRTIETDGVRRRVDDKSAAAIVERGGAKYVEEFDPADHTVAEVTEHLATADPAEVERVTQAEATGQNRKGIVGDDE